MAPITRNSHGEKKALVTMMSQRWHEWQEVEIVAKAIVTMMDRQWHKQEEMAMVAKAMVPMMSHQQWHG